MRKILAMLLTLSAITGFSQTETTDGIYFGIDAGIDFTAQRDGMKQMAVKPASYTISAPVTFQYSNWLAEAKFGAQLNGVPFINVMAGRSFGDRVLLLAGIRDNIILESLTKIDRHIVNSAFLLRFNVAYCGNTREQRVYTDISYSAGLYSFAIGIRGIYNAQ